MVGYSRSKVKYDTVSDNKLFPEPTDTTSYLKVNNYSYDSYTY